MILGSRPREMAVGEPVAGRRTGGRFPFPLAGYYLFTRIVANNSTKKVGQLTDG